MFLRALFVCMRLEKATAPRMGQRCYIPPCPMSALCPRQWTAFQGVSAVFVPLPFLFSCPFIQTSSAQTEALTCFSVTCTLDCLSHVLPVSGHSQAEV